MRNLLRLCPLLLALPLLFGAEPAFAGKRVALVIANSAYQHAPSLANPVNDGTVMAVTLKGAGFDIVESRHDLSALDTRRVLREFADATRDADIAVVYYAGHGIEVEGSNYLIPVDAKLERDTDVYDEALSLDRVLVAVEPAKQLRLVILDACRDNPFGRTMKRTIASRGIGRGLAQVEPTSPNTLIAYSAKAGFTAQDGDGANSPFAIALSKHLATPGLDVRRAFGYVRDDVLKSTGNKQEPFVYGSLGGEDVPLVPVKATAAPASVLNPQADIRRDYELALQVGNRPAWEAFLAQHPDGFYASLAKLQLEKIGAEQAHAAATEKAKQAEAERDRLAALGAQKDAQAKAAADAKAAERAQLAAQKAKEQAQQQAAAAEQQRVNLAAAAPSAAPASTASPAGTNVASLTPATTPADLSRSVQIELSRVGCFSGQADGNWNTSSQRSLSQFNRYAGTKLDVKVASTDALDTVKAKPSRVCPLVCEHGFKVDGDKCTKIVCGNGYLLNDDNECEKKRTAKPATAKRDDSEERPALQRRQAGGA
ncbi:caspase (peptidase), partial [Bradyrhizobium sp. NAS80.1]|uniref:caspase family protein n=1 Tax=Bradyrhizobium sp. NAS80.1 TaxID=1680159 RepID=UPI00095DA17C